MILVSEMISGISLIFAAAAFAVSILAYRQARKTSLLSSRREAINHIRAAVSDVIIHGNIDNKTTSSIREGYQISTLVFSRKISRSLDTLHGISFRLQHKPLDRQTDQDWSDKDLLADDLNKVLAKMQSEAAVPR